MIKADKTHPRKIALFPLPRERATDNIIKKPKYIIVPQCQRTTSKQVILLKPFLNKTSILKKSFSELDNIAKCNPDSYY